MADRHEYTRGLICPWCGREDEDVWERDLEDEKTTQIECLHCEREFNVTLYISYRYSTDTDGIKEARQ